MELSGDVKIIKDYYFNLLEVSLKRDFESFKISLIVSPSFLFAFVCLSLHCFPVFDESLHLLCTDTFTFQAGEFILVSLFSDQKKHNFFPVGITGFFVRSEKPSFSKLWFHSMWYAGVSGHFWKFLVLFPTSSPGPEAMLLYNSAEYYKDLKHKQYKI